MRKLPPLSSKELIKALRRAGFEDPPRGEREATLPSLNVLLAKPG